MALSCFCCNRRVDTFHSSHELERPMKLTHVLAAAAISFAVPAQAQVVGPFGPGNIGNLDNLTAVLLGQHRADFTGFVDSFIFNVSGPAGFGSGILPLLLIDPTLPASDAATIAAIALVDGMGTVLAFDADGTDGFALTSTLSAAGNYGFVVAGVGGAGAGIYAALASTRLLDVPEPATYALTLLGLGLCLRRLAQRQR
jgi:hypothetical protein